jgi:hypothetical protein
MHYKNAFSKDKKDIGTTDMIEHCINTGDARPIRQHPRRIPLAKMTHFQVYKRLFLVDLFLKL